MRAGVLGQQSGRRRFSETEGACYRYDSRPNHIQAPHPRHLSWYDSVLYLAGMSATGGIRGAFVRLPHGQGRGRLAFYVAGGAANCDARAVSVSIV